MAVITVHAAGLHRALMHGERSQETRSAVAGVGCRMPFGIPGSEWKFRLSSVQCLYLRFLVHAENQHVIRRIHIQTNNGRLFGLKFRIWALAAPVMNLVGLERRSFQNPMNRCAPQTGYTSKLSSTPGVRSSKRLLTRQPHHIGTLPRGNAGGQLSGLILETVHSWLKIAFATSGNSSGSIRSTLISPDVRPSADEQDHLSPPTISLLSPMRTNPHFQRSLLLSSQLKRNRLPGHAHDQMYSTLTSGTQH